MCKLKSVCSSEMCLYFVKLSHDWQELGINVAIASFGSADKILTFHYGWSAWEI